MFPLPSGHKIYFCKNDVRCKSCFLTGHVAHFCRAKCLQRKVQMYIQKDSIPFPDSRKKAQLPSYPDEPDQRTTQRPPLTLVPNSASLESSVAPSSPPATETSAWKRSATLLLSAPPPPPRPMANFAVDPRPHVPICFRLLDVDFVGQYDRSAACFPWSPTGEVQRECGNCHFLPGC